MRQTNNLGLALYDGEDKMNITGAENSLNHNMELIDANFKKISDKKADKIVLEDLRNDRKLLWNDEFDFLDTEKWAVAGDYYQDWSGAHYTSDGTIECRNSVLKMTAQKVNDEKVKCPLIISRNGFRRGLIEIKAKMEMKNNVFGGIWSLTNPPISEGGLVYWEGNKIVGELDIAEPAVWDSDYVEKRQFTSSVHLPDNTQKSYVSDSVYYTLDDDWHIFGAEVLDDGINVYKDRVLIKKLRFNENIYKNKNPFHELGLYIILNFMIYNKEAIANMDTEPVSYYFDWMRVYAPDAVQEVPVANHMVFTDTEWNEYGYSDVASANDQKSFVMQAVENNLMYFGCKFYPLDAIIMPRINGYILPSSGEQVVWGMGRLINNGNTPYRLTIRTDIGDFPLFIKFGLSGAESIKNAFPYVMDKVTQVSDGTPIILEPDKMYVFGEASTLNLVLTDSVPEEYAPDEESKQLLAMLKENYACRYYFEFTSGSTPTALTITGARNTFTPEANKTYLVTVIDGFVTVVSI